MAQRKKARKGTIRGWKIILRDVILFGVALNVFALFHHVLPQKMKPVDASRYVSAAVAPPATQMASSTPTVAEVSATPAPSAAPVAGDFSASFPASDTGAGALYSYQTNDVRIAIHRTQENSVTYFIADVYVRTIDALKTAFAKGSYGKNIYDEPLNTAQTNAAVLAVSGDYYSARSLGVVIRNGTLYRDAPGKDVCILYQDGTMQTYSSDGLSLTDAITRGVWQAWSFGPALLDEAGDSISEFDSKLTDRHPRSAIGYYAPGHYCFVIVDGRQKGYSIGMRLSELSSLMHRLGCKQAYNLDGGATAVMIFQGQIINQPYQGGRESGDIIYFT